MNVTGIPQLLLLLAHRELHQTEFTRQFILLFFKAFSLMRTICKVLLNLLQGCFCFYDLFSWPRGMWDLSSLTRNWTCPHCNGRWNLNHQNTREVPGGNLEGQTFAVSKWECISHQHLVLVNRKGSCRQGDRLVETTQMTYTLMGLHINTDPL